MMPCVASRACVEKCETHEVHDAVSANLYNNTRNLGGAPNETTFLVPSRTKIMRQGVPRVASLDAVQLRCAAEHKGFTGFRVIIIKRVTVTPAQDFDLRGGFHYSGSCPMVFQHSGALDFDLRGGFRDECQTLKIR